MLMAVIADDLTGAADSGVQFVRAGYGTAVIARWNASVGRMLRRVREGHRVRDTPEAPGVPWLVEWDKEELWTSHRSRGRGLWISR